jgi:hypothetical protein
VFPTAALFADTVGAVPEEDLHCQWYPWVLAYDLADILKQPFLNARYVRSTAVSHPAWQKHRDQRV